jgi:hypothetical protein
MARRNKKQTKIVVVDKSVRVRSAKQQARLRRRRNKRRAGPKGMMNPDAMSLAMKVCAVTNPFCPEAMGSKYPDDSYVKTLTYDIEGVPSSIVTNASGQGAQLWVGDTLQTATGTVGAWPTVTFTTLAAAQTMPTTVSTYRLTSWGLKFSCTGTKMNTKGMLRVRLFSPLNGTAIGNVAVTTVLADEAYDIPLSKLIDTSLFVLPKPLGKNARLFRDPSLVSATLSSWVNPGWQIVTVAVDGGEASGSTVEVAPYYHFEYVPDDGSILSTYATKPPPNNVLIQQASESSLEKAGGFIEGVANTVDKVFKSKAFQYIATAAAGAYGGPNAALTAYSSTNAYRSLGSKSSGMIMDVD